jgi:hypothetical protein
LVFLETPRSEEPSAGRVAVMNAGFGPGDLLDMLFEHDVVVTW